MIELGCVRVALRRALLVAISTLALASACAHTPPPAQTAQPRRALMESLVERDPSAEPRLVFLLLGEYGATHQQRAGLAFFERVLDRHGDALEPGIRALYLSVVGALRAQTADEIRLLRRIAWVERGLDELDEAVRLTAGELYIVRWLRAQVLAQLPDRFERAEQALPELAWCEAHADEAPAPGLLREVLFQQARLHRVRGDDARAAAFLARSGYRSFDRPRALNTPFTMSTRAGFTFDRPAVREVIPGRVFHVLGRDFMEFYFVRSEGGAELVAIDAGSSDEAARDAVEALRAAHPDLPSITTVLITHAHWDHVGGHGFFRGLEPAPRIVASVRWAEQLHHQEGSGGPYARWWGTRFDLEAVTAFRPDETVAEPRTIEVDGTPIELIPTRGGETLDALLFHFPEEGVLFAGDVAMPFFGAPHADEGDPRGLLETLATIEALEPEHVLHGHQGINRLFPTLDALVGLRGPLRWLADETDRLLAEAVPRAEIHQRNLVPPELAPACAVPYVVVREHVINRLADQRRGYWQEPFSGGDQLSARDLGTLFTHYAAMDDGARVEMVERMVEAGDHELALRVIQWLRPHHEDGASLDRLEREALLALVDRHQTLDAFKFIWYGGAAGLELGPELPAGGSR